MFWLTAFHDLAPEDFDRAVEFWREVTGYAVSEPRGPEGEFVSFVPPDGDVYLKAQRLVRGPSKVHLDVHVEDLEAAVSAAEGLGAHVRLRHELGYVVMASPGGFVFCFVTHPGSRTPAPGVVDQVCLDVPEPAYDAECAFWEALTGWEPGETARLPEFRWLVRPDDQPLQLLLQRLGEQRGDVRAHVDLSAHDQEAEVQRHRALGAEVSEIGAGWVVMTPPAGPAYCITGRAPGMRMPARHATG
jgi:predicted enzyme related to lactoylglutathione lyase